MRESTIWRIRQIEEGFIHSALADNTLWDLPNRPFHRFFNIDIAGNSALKLGNSSSLKVTADIAPKVEEMYRSLCGGGGGRAQTYPLPPTIQKSYIFFSFQQITFKLGIFANFKGLFGYGRVYSS